MVQREDTGEGISPKQWVGQRGEAIAEEHLIEQGWEIVDRNREFDIGELDIVARQSEWTGRERLTTFAFVEVKTRRSSTGVRSGANITRQKRARLVRLARLYLAVEELERVFARIDVIEVDLGGDEPVVYHYPRAIDAYGRLR